jgi:hypothetical protein
MANNLTATALDIIQDALEGARTSYAPEPRPLPKGMTMVPFAVMAWDDGMDYDGDGNAYFDSPPCDFVWSAHHTVEAAEASLAKAKALCPKGSFWVVEDHICPDYHVEEPAMWS